MIYSIIKRLLDIILSLIGLLILTPVFIIIIIGLYFANEGAGIFFTQSRPGRNDKIFNVLKFKTMTDERDNEGKLLPDALRMTRVGRFVRSTSLDEIPQLLNVLKGDMSLIGPRPLLVRYLPLYNAEQARRHEVRPGITGWAQVNGRNAISWEQKLKLDVWYVDNISFALDVKILWMTVVKVLKREGISADKEATNKPFEGDFGEGRDFRELSDLRDVRDLKEGGDL